MESHPLANARNSADSSRASSPVHANFSSKTDSLPLLEAREPELIGNSRRKVLSTAEKLLIQIQRQNYQHEHDEASDATFEKHNLNASSRHGVSMENKPGITRHVSDLLVDIGDWYSSEDEALVHEGGRRESLEADMLLSGNYLQEKGRKGIRYDVLEEYMASSGQGNEGQEEWGPHRAFHAQEQEKTVPLRFTFYSTATNTVHARSLHEIPQPGQSLSALLKAGCFWIDVLSPTDQEMRLLGKIFRLHPLTLEDVIQEESREKCEVFKNYHFMCFQGYDQDPHSSALEPLSLYMIVLKEGILTFHFQPMPYPAQVRRRIKQLKGFVEISPDWINYALIDSITDSFEPIIKSIAFEVDSIDELVLLLKESEQSDMLRRIGHCRKKLISMLRLLGNKPDAVKGLIKRVENADVLLYLGDVQDHITTMNQTLSHLEKISSRSHSNYLAQISMEITATSNATNDILAKLTVLGSILLPMNLITGLWGMNVPVPGQFSESLSWFYGIFLALLCFATLLVLLLRFIRLL
ncbi:uncharacterized protein VTP21DRAFT_7604 [Calcarisporiella thermophila]|uniref:uncharacterized protein n=1 Tax=Calcarisporiella thermophila TaxID=911321 RepID=UPI00374316E5